MKKWMSLVLLTLLVGGVTQTVLADQDNKDVIITDHRDHRDRWDDDRFDDDFDGRFDDRWDDRRDDRWDDRRDDRWDDRDDGDGRFGRHRALSLTD
jgi:hypothetical protein